LASKTIARMLGRNIRELPSLDNTLVKHWRKSASVRSLTIQRSPGALRPPGPGENAIGLLHVLATLLLDGEFAIAICPIPNRCTIRLSVTRPHSIANVPPYHLSNLDIASTNFRAVGVIQINTTPSPNPQSKRRFGELIPTVRSEAVADFCPGGGNKPRSYVGVQMTQLMPAIPRIPTTSLLGPNGAHGQYY
jgi:hypothetical protein